MGLFFELLGSVVILAVCVGACWGIGYDPVGNQIPGDNGPVAVYAAMVAVGIQWIVFVPSFAAGTEKFYDLTGSITYTLVAVATLLYRVLYSNPGAANNVRPIVSTALVIVWAARLGSFLVRRIFRDGKDGRFDEIKTSFALFLRAWTAQGMWVTLTLLSVLTINTTAIEVPLGPADYVGWAVWLIGFLLEAIADEQKKAFAKLRTGKWIEVGLWRYSRHPNYFGEMTLWVGQFIVGISVYRGAQWIAVLSPLFVIFLISKISGLPMLEKRADDKWGSDPEYRRYKKTVSVLVPWFRRDPGAEYDQHESDPGS